MPPPPTSGALRIERRELSRPVTPARRSSTCAIRVACAARARPYCAAGNAMRAVSTPRVSKPIGSCCRLIALRTSSAAPASTIITSAACAPISSLPHPRLERSAERALAVAEILGEGRAARRLPRRQQADEHRAAEDQRQRRRQHRCRSSAAVSRRGTPSGASRISTGSDHHAIARPAMPPSAASTRLSVSTCLTMRPRPAPIAARIASSRERAASRASSRLATLPQAISSTSADRGQQDEQPQSGSRRRRTRSAARRRRSLAIEVRMIRREALRDAHELVADLLLRDVLALPRVRSRDRTRRTSPAVPA